MQTWRRIGIGSLVFIAGIGIVFSILKKTLLSPTYAYDRLVEFRTASELYLIPAEFVDPGSVFSYPVSDFNDDLGASVDLAIERDLLVQGESDYTASGKPSASGFITATLAEPDKRGRMKLRFSETKMEAVSLSGGFEGGTFEFDENLGLYRVFPDRQGQSQNNYWDLVSTEPSADYEVDDRMHDKWVATCTKGSGGKGEVCQFEEEVSGFYAFIAANEEDYLVLDEIAENLARQIDMWGRAGAGVQ